MIYPTLEEIDHFSRFQICQYYRFLPSPQNDEQVKIMNKLVERFNEMGGFTPSISKAVGWENT